VNVYVISKRKSQLALEVPHLIMQIIDKILSLVTAALESIDDPNIRLSAIIRKAIRIARLRNDFDNLWWLEWEMMEWTDKEARKRIICELAPHYTDELFNIVQKQLGMEYASERRCMSLDREGKIVDKKQIIGQSVEDLEARLQYFDKIVEDAVPPAGLTPIDLYFVDKQKTELRTQGMVLTQDNRKILARIRQRVHSFLSTTEHQLLYGKLNSDIFERNRIYVDSRLREIAPDAIDKFSLIYKRLNENDAEARSHALTSCRRLLKDIADVLYPPSICPVAGPDGKEHKLTEERYIARLWQFVYEKMSGQKSGELLLSTINDLGTRIDKVYDLSCKGVHNNVPEFEVNQCVIQTYLIIGDILRLYDNRSAIGLEDHNLYNNK
jgi:hypothetical protein